MVFNPYIYDVYIYIFILLDHQHSKNTPSPRNTAANAANTGTWHCRVTNY